MTKSRLATLALALAAAALSFHFSVKAAKAMSPTESWGELCALAAVWEAAKLLLGPRAIMGLMTERTRAWLGPTGHVVSLGFVGVLMAGSVAATYVATRHVSGERQAASQAAMVAAVRASPEHQALVADVASYDKRIFFLSSLATAQMQDNQRTAAKRTHDEIAVLQSEKNATTTRLQNMTNTNNIYTHIMHTDSRWQWVSVAVAVALEIISVVAFVVFHTENVSPDMRSHTKDTNVISERPDALKRPSVSSAILGGDINPTVRDIMQYKNVSQNAAQRTLSILAREGVVQKRGKRYVVSTEVIHGARNTSSKAELGPST